MMGGPTVVDQLPAHCLPASATRAARWPAAGRHELCDRLSLSAPSPKGRRCEDFEHQGNVLAPAAEPAAFPAGKRSAPTPLTPAPEPRNIVPAALWPQRNALIG